MNRSTFLKAIVLILCATASLPAQEEGTSGQVEEQVEVPEAYVDRIRKAGGFLELTLQDAIALALSQNLEIEIENYNEELNRERIIGTRGFFDPVLTMSLGWNSNSRPNTSVLDAGAGIPSTITKRWTLNTQVRQNVPGGGALTVQFNNNRNTTNSTFSLFNPQYGTTLGFTFDQPLWRGFRKTQTRRQLKISNLNAEISDSQFAQRVAEIVQQVENQYWELVHAIENYEARRRSLDLALVQHRDNLKRVEIGVLAPIEITSSRAESATREQEMIQSEVQIINSQNALKNLLAPNPDAAIWNLSLIPTDQPQAQDVHMTLQEAIDTALRNRPELEQIRLQLQQTEIDREYFKSQAKPSVDLTFGLTSTGTSGLVLRPSLRDTDGDGVPDTPGGPPVPATDAPFFGNFKESLGGALDYEFLNYNVAVSVEIPIRNRSNSAQLAEVGITERQLLSRLRSQQQTIMVEVRNAYESIATQKKRLEAAKAATSLSQEQLDGETQRFGAGLSTNFEILRLQRDLVSAQVLELRAMVDYQLAVTALQKATFAIVNDGDITLAKRAETQNR